MVGHNCKQTEFESGPTYAINYNSALDAAENNISIIKKDKPTTLNALPISKQT